jgi:methyltransferase
LEQTAPAAASNADFFCERELLMRYAVALLAFVTLQRLGDLVWAAQNAARLLASGGVEFGRKQYPALVVLIVGWLGGLWFWGYDRPVHATFVIIYALLQCCRLWVLMSLGRRFTTRIIVLPGASLVASGPYRVLKHPAYFIGSAEMAVVPLALGMPIWAALFFVLNVIGLAIRIRTENRALDWATGIQAHREGKKAATVPTIAG